MKFEFLQANNGDAILIHFNDGSNNRNILIDGGTGSTYSKKLRNKPTPQDLQKSIEIIKRNGESIDLLVLTHVDDDHIGGILKWFGKDKSALDLLKNVWFNSGRTIHRFFDAEKNYDNSLELNKVLSTDTSIGQGVEFEDYLLSKPGIWEEKVIKAGQKLSKFGIDFQILSPDEDRLKDLLGKWEIEKPDSLDTSLKNDYDKSLTHLIQDDAFEEDSSKHNGSSISFILTYKKKNYLFLADSFPTVVSSSLEMLGYSEQSKLECEFVKVSHHGSKANNSYELLQFINSKKYVISTNGAKHSHPNKQFLARLITYQNDCEIYFNYPELIKDIFKQEDYEAYPKFKALKVKGEF
ncbi:MBL fold metallo-hydrolase [Carboxylicivirga sp. A043]|uniref:ComEC/Rec2 family competence protein n=1 Tax=Carboxylicivirga litoralis TaxID=2816963 RepID=UPI0021CB2F7B|nr:MBL fold metallo-hydrolase [Carboxylicivirga sp. A043]MCU4158264.1 MBL fold metallo-hydrolase [Carboxylicivirga sp. A043]